MLLLSLRHRTTVYLCPATHLAAVLGLIRVVGFLGGCSKCSVHRVSSQQGIKQF